MDNIVSWFSAGVSSAIATKIALQTHPNLEIIYTHIEDQHPDTLRFITDCEKWFNKKIEINQSPLKSVNNACRAAGFVNSPYGASCTRLLKKRVRKEWELGINEEYIYVWGIDCTEKKRAERITETMSENKHIFPLIDRNIDKKTAHGLLKKAGIERPAMYDLGYPNNNCIGCIKGGMGYWNKIRQDFPEVFKQRCEMEEIIGGRVFKEFLLKDLPLDKGRKQKVIVPDCGIACELEDMGN